MSPLSRLVGLILVVLVVPSALYFYTCAPGIGMGDTALMMEYVHFKQLGTQAYMHNIANLIGRAFYELPGPNPARKVNLASVFTGGLAVFLYGLLLLRVLRSRLMAVLCTGVLMVSHSMWWHSTIAESYAVNALFMVVALWLLFAPGGLKDWRLVLLFLIGGLALFNHLQMAIVVGGAGIALLVTWMAVLRGPSRDGETPTLIRRLGRIVGLGLLGSLAFLLGLIPWLLVFRQDVERAGFEASVFALKGAGFQSLMLQGDPVEGLGDVLYLLFQQFPGPFLFAALVGLVILARRYQARQFWAFAGMLVVNTGFFALYDTWDRFAFLLPSFVMLAFAGSVAVDTLWTRLSQPAKESDRPHARSVAQGVIVAALAFSILFPPWFYSRLSDWGNQPGFWRRQHGNAYMSNIIDFAEYKANPNKRHWREAEIYADLLFEKLPRGAIYIDDDSRGFYSVEYFRRFYRKRRDLRVMLINSWGFARWGLTRENFKHQLTSAYYAGSDLFIPALRHPYREFMPTGPPRLKFEFYRLDEGHHIYRLITVRDRAERTPAGR